MHVDRIKYTRYFKETDQWLGTEVVLNEEDERRDGWRLAFNTVDEGYAMRHGDSRPTQQAIGPVPIAEIKTEKVPEEDRKKSLIADIKSCQEVKVLESYKLLAKANPDLKAAYDQRLKELQNFSSLDGPEPQKSMYRPGSVDIDD